MAIIGVMGWSVVNSVVGGQILSSVSDDKIPLWAGIVIIAAISLIVAIAGIKQLIRVEAFLSIPVNCAFLLLYIVASQKFDYLTWKDAVVATEGSEYSAAATVKGNWLSFSHYVIPLLQLGVLLLLIIIFYSQKILQIGKSLPLLFRDLYTNNFCWGSWYFNW